MSDMVITGPVAGVEPVLTHVPFPNGARIAVNFGVALEAWSENGVSGSVFGDAGVAVEAYARGVRDWATISSQDYGGRTGIWRILRTLDRYGVPASVSTSGYVAVKWPEVVKAVAAAGHEIVAHGYYHDRPQNGLDEKEDLDIVTRTTGVLESVSGYRPVGWSSHAARRGNYTIQSMFKCGYLYSGDFRDADIPYLVAESGGKRIFAAPRTDEVNDMVLMRNHGAASSVYVEYFKRSFDQLYEEGATQPSVLASVAHATLIGRPWGAPTLAECIRYVKQFPDVWIATRRAVIENYVAALDADRG